MALSDADYRMWLRDQSRNKNRIVLVEIGHSAGALRVANRPYRSETNVIYNSFLSGVPVIDERLNDETTRGDFKIINPVGFRDFSTYEWRGFGCVFRYGDETWNLSDFKIINTALIASVIPNEGRTHTVKLLDNTYLYSTKVANTASIEDTVQAVLDWIATDGTFSPIVATSLSAALLAREVFVVIDEDTTYSDILNVLAVAVGGFWRITGMGTVELADYETVTSAIITSDMIIDKSVKVVQSVNAVNRVKVNYDFIDGYEVPNVGNSLSSSISNTTGANTGLINETLEVDTALTSGADASALLTKLTADYSVTKTRWSFDINQTINDLVMGQRVTINHSSVSGTGNIKRIKRAFNGSQNTIEVEL